MPLQEKDSGRGAAEHMVRKAELGEGSWDERRGRTARITRRDRRRRTIGRECAVDALTPTRKARSERESRIRSAVKVASTRLSDPQGISPPSSSKLRLLLTLPFPFPLLIHEYNVSYTLKYHLGDPDSTS